MVLTLNNSTLTVELVDPRQDAHLLGARYCHGGYIFQVTDIDHGELLGTPARPYNVFDGQGIPDAFNLSPLREAGETTTPTDSTTALIIGVGLCDTSVTPRDVTADPSAPTGVLDAAEWTVEPAYDTLYNVADGRTRTPQPTVTPDEAAPVIIPTSTPMPTTPQPAEPGLPLAERAGCCAGSALHDSAELRRVFPRAGADSLAARTDSALPHRPAVRRLRACAPCPLPLPSDLCTSPAAPTDSPHSPISCGARPSTPSDGLCPIQLVRSHVGWRGQEHGRRAHPSPLVPPPVLPVPAARAGRHDTPVQVQPRLQPGSVHQPAHFSLDNGGR